MGSRLTNNVTSKYFHAANHLRPKWKKMKIIAYVESYDDIAFWRDILGEFETDDTGIEPRMLPLPHYLSRTDAANPSQILQEELCLIITNWIVLPKTT